MFSTSFDSTTKEFALKNLSIKKQKKNNNTFIKLINQNRIRPVEIKMNT